MRVLRIAIMSVAGFVVAFSASAAFADLAQYGYTSSGTGVDGSRADVTGKSFNPNFGQCVLYSTLVANTQSGSSFRQVQAGIVKCDSVTLSGCQGNYGFVETIIGSTFNCQQGNSFQTSVPYAMQVQRNSSTSNMMTGTSRSATASAGGFGLSDAVAVTWAEATSGGSQFCPVGAHNGRIDSWQRYKYGIGWVTVNAPNLYANNGAIDPPCWLPLSYSGGGYDLQGN